MRYPEVACFWSIPAPFADESLRRYARSDTNKCPGPYGTHDATVLLGEVPLPPDDVLWGRDDIGHADPRWPTACDSCGYVFAATDKWQHNFERKYADVNVPTRRFTMRKPIAGAMFNAEWLAKHLHGEDGMCLTVILPNLHEWQIDSRASNCTMPDDNVHHCWVRHGDPRTGLVTVDKRGVTCNAGAGSIQAGDYHGFLRNGRLVLA